MNREIVEKGMVDNQERLFFAYRPDDGKIEYISKVVRTLREKGKGKTPFRYALLLSKVFHLTMPKEVVEELGKRLEKEIDGVSDKIKIEIKPYGS